MCKKDTKRQVNKTLNKSFVCKGRGEILFLQFLTWFIFCSAKMNLYFESRKRIAKKMKLHSFIYCFMAFSTQIKKRKTRLPFSWCDLGGTQVRDTQNRNLKVTEAPGVVGCSDFTFRLHHIVVSTAGEHCRRKQYGRLKKIL
jgi:hypothetical protein